MKKMFSLLKEKKVSSKYRDTVSDPPQVKICCEQLGYNVK